jgi:hypothetical protein
MDHMTAQRACSFLRLRVTAEADPGALARILERFQNRNIMPRCVRAEWGIGGVLHVHVDITGVPDETMSLITAKLNQVPCVLNAHWHRV